MSSNRFTLRSAVYLMPIKDNQILLLRRFNTGWMDGKYSLIAGHIDGNESVFIAMIREAKEEAGITIKKDKLIPAHTMHRKSSDYEYIDFFFLAKSWKGEPKIMEQEKCDDMQWFSIDKLPENLLPHVKFALKCYQDGVAFSEFGWD